MPELMLEVEHEPGMTAGYETDITRIKFNTAHAFPREITAEDTALQNTVRKHISQKTFPLPSSYLTLFQNGE